MSESLQEFGYRESPYIRPGQNWICGYAADGRACQIGPDNKGHCRGGYECDPSHADDRWHCTRSQLAGGPCEDGPLPDGQCCRQVQHCRPVRSWRARRGVITKWVTAVVAALLVVVLAGNYRTAFINPGSLSLQHAGLTDCGSCHQAFHQGLVGWWQAAWLEDVATDDSEPCIVCHAMGDRGFLPHSQPRELTSSLSNSVSPATASGSTIGVRLANLVFDSPRKLNATLPCMSCHQEHQGADADLTKMSNDRCTICHLVQFESLASGHPDFKNYPYERRTPLQFDHLSHATKWFVADKAKYAPLECTDCHKSDANGRLMTTRGFETSCSSCHGEQIAGAGRASEKGMPVLAVPGFDVETLQEKGVAIGEWPKFAEGPVPNFMRMLMSADDGFKKADAVFSVLDDPLDLSEATVEQLAAVETLAWSVKSLLYDLQTTGVAALYKRLTEVLQRPLTTAEKISLTAMLPLDTVINAQRSWFPALGADIPRWRNGEKVAIPLDETSPTSLNSEEDNDGLDPKHADDDDIDSDMDDEDEFTFEDDDEDEDEDEVASRDDYADDLVSNKDSDDIDGPKKNMDAISREIETASGENWNSFGGWYRDEFTIRYRPTGHADEFIVAWANLTGGLAPNLKEAGQVFETLIDKKSPGLCGKCHSVDQGTNGGFVVNWRGLKPLEGLKKSVHFSHAAHLNLLHATGLSLLNDKECTTCHVPDLKANFASGFRDRDPTTFRTNFKDMPRQVCVECHTADKAGDDCLTCHNYHLGVYDPLMYNDNGLDLKETK